MHGTGLRALCQIPTASIYTRISTLTSHHGARSFHRSHVLRKGPPDGPAEDGKSPDKPAEEKEGGTGTSNGGSAPENIENDATVEPFIRRARSPFFSSSRARLARTRVADDLPLVKLPPRFLKDNVHIRNSSGIVGSRLEDMREDAWHYRYMGTDWVDIVLKDVEAVFDQASWSDSSLQNALQDVNTGNFDSIMRRSSILEQTSLFLVWLVVEKLRLTTRQQRPFAATDIAELLRYGLSPMSAQIVKTPQAEPSLPVLLSQSLTSATSSRDRGTVDEDSTAALRNLVEEGIRNGFPYREIDRVPELSPRSRGEIVMAVRAELTLEPEESLGSREVKRPVTVINIPNYSGKHFSKIIMQHIASHVDADLIRLDAQDLAMIVGDYLGQDLAYSRGPLSVLGFRAAEMNGRLSKPPPSEPPATQADDDDFPGGIEATWVNIRQQAIGGLHKGTLEEELQKIRDGSKDYVLPSVDRWENLKINAVLEEITKAGLKNSSRSEGRRLIIHVDDFVELNMNLEGALLLGRLRHIVDGMWREGTKVVIVGTSANSDPSAQYSSTLRDVAAEECLIPILLQYESSFAEAGSTPDGYKRFNQANDNMLENLRNIQNMLKSISGPSTDDYNFRIFGVPESKDPSAWVWDNLDISQWTLLRISRLPRILTSSIMPLSDVYHIARLLSGYQGTTKPDKAWKVLLDVIQSSSKYSEPITAQKKPQTLKSASTDARSPETPERVHAGGNYNDQEKKLLTGLVNSNEIKTTFADVHAPIETISALKLLTSLSLIRPEAFSYGVLATDRIPGCLLYGPPGTGKTLLAKAVAKESGANMLEVSGASINDMYVGQSEKNVRALFTLAKKLSPCVIFIDEADALLAARGARSRNAHRETINQFLREWDGISDTKAFIMVATNRPFDLDEAVLRRLPRKILVDLPVQQDRASILSILLKDENLDSSVSIEQISQKTILYSGSDLKNLCVAAAMAAVQEEQEAANSHTGPEPYVYPPKRTLRQDHFDKALKEIAASISEDMDSLKAIRSFDEKYGNPTSRAKKRKSMGFGVVPGKVDAEEARVRKVVV